MSKTSNKKQKNIIVGLRCGFEIWETTSVEFKSIPKEFWALQYCCFSINAPLKTEQNKNNFLLWVVQNYAKNSDFTKLFCLLISLIEYYSTMQAGKNDIIIPCEGKKFFP